MSQIRGRESDAEFVRRVCIVGGIAALVAMLYKLSDVVLLSFGRFSLLWSYGHLRGRYRLRHL